MTVSTEVSREEYTGNGVTTDFDYRFRVFSAADLVVSVADTTETISVLTLNTDYTVTGAGSRTGGKVKLLSPLAFNWRISIERALPVTQETDVRNQGNFFPEVHEDAWDKLTMLIQQVWSYFGLALRKPTWLAKYYDALGNRIANLGNPINEQDAATKSYVDSTNDSWFKRTLRVPESYVAPVPPVSMRRNKIGAYNDAGDPIAVLPESGSAADVMIEFAKPTGAQLSGYRAYTVADRLDESISVMSIHGVVGDGINDDQPAIQGFLGLMVKGSLYFPGGFNYKFNNDLVINNNCIRVFGDVAYAGGFASRIICGRANMNAFVFGGYACRIENLGIQGFEVLDDEIAYGQTCTCTAVKFLRSDGSKDIDSSVRNLQINHVKHGIYMSGINLSIEDCLFTSALYPIYAQQLDNNTELRGVIIRKNRFHHSGGGDESLTAAYPELLGSSCIVMSGKYSRGNVIENNYGDAGIRSMFNGQLGRACKLSDNTILRAYGDIFIIDNTELPAANESFESSGNVLVNDDPIAANHSGYMYNLTNVASANIYGNIGNYLRKGGILNKSSRYCTFNDNLFVNINTNFASDGLVYDGIYFDENSTDNHVNGFYIRQTLGLSFRSVFNNQGKYNHIVNYGPRGQGTVSPTIRGDASITTGIVDARRRPRLEFFGDIPPTEGDYQRGDVMWHLSVGAGRYMGHTCAESGNPGVWKEFAKIED